MRVSSGRLRLAFATGLSTCAAFASGASTLVARNLVYHVDPGQDVVVTLKGYSMAGRALTVSIASLPAAGFLYQLSQVYSDYGYDPKKTPTAISTTPALVTGSNARVVFSRPFSNSPLDSKFAQFTYTVNDGLTTSAPGTITISQGPAVMSSQFYVDTEGWSIRNNNNQQPVYDPTSYGIMSYYIYGTESVIQTQPTSSDDAQLWYFTAPSKFLGNQWSTYGGTLTFTLSASEGDFAASNRNTPASTPLVILDCATCNLNAGVRLAWPQTLSPTFTGSAQTFTIPLSETAGWITDPKNTLLPWTPPSQCAFVEVVTKLSELSILGDFTRSHETVALDSVVLSHGPGQPLTCYGAF
ncbi:hypothetical protein H310_07221 [Aphanomyces invadans]|uniref:Laminin IV type A domain-containing protein n=1 Tax=Aphanomyces invadans TaxID=157072 RepID=A0A024U324_9STRA|nr:hypothetical protein H310_07221 [Aphanomyces invadans]ETW00654.1 hypothetical protein H310_07221 [Aphanomyces invadans]|eukprot:XP_008870789.1 hypothetical protein H310_07221 [Aphanomyces invadans]